MYARSRSLRYVAEKDLGGQVTHGTIDKFIRGSAPQYATRQLFHGLYLREHQNDLPTDPEPELVAIYLLYLLNRIPDEQRHSTYVQIVDDLERAHLRAGADVPPWVRRLRDLYEDDEPPQPPPAPPPPPPKPEGGSATYDRPRRKKKDR